MWCGWQFLTHMLWGEDKWGGERASALERKRGSERAYVSKGGRVGERVREKERTGGWVLWNPLTGELCAFVRRLGCLPNLAHCNRGMIVDSRQPSLPPRLPLAWTQPSAHRWHGKTCECFSLLPLLFSSLLILYSPALSPVLGSPLFLFCCVADLAVAVCSVSAVSLALSLPCCSSCWWVGRKPWQFSLCRPPSFPFSLPVRSWVPFTGRTTTPLCVLLLCVYVCTLALLLHNHRIGRPNPEGYSPRTESPHFGLWRPACCRPCGDLESAACLLLAPILGGMSSWSVVFGYPDN